MRARILFWVLCVVGFSDGVRSEDQDSMSIGPRYHLESGFDHDGAIGDNLSWGKSMPLYKRYPEVVKIALPAPDFGGLTVEEAIRKRQSERSFADKPLTLKQLSQLLLSADGITHKRWGTEMRAAPSAGALYPIELYVIVYDVESLDPGLYHFQVSDSSLELVREGDLNPSINAVVFSDDNVGFSPVTFIMSARFARCTQKYADRGYRYTYIEAGAICENIYLQAASLGLATFVVGAFNDAALNRLLEVDGTEEAGLLIMPCGYLSE